MHNALVENIKAFNAHDYGKAHASCSGRFIFP